MKQRTYRRQKKATRIPKRILERTPSKPPKKDVSPSSRGLRVAVGIKRTMNMYAHTVANTVSYCHCYMIEDMDGKKWVFLIYLIRLGPLKKGQLFRAQKGHRAQRGCRKKQSRNGPVTGHGMLLRHKADSGPQAGPGMNVKSAAWLLLPGWQNLLPARMLSDWGLLRMLHVLHSQATQITAHHFGLK